LWTATTDSVQAKDKGNNVLAENEKVNIDSLRIVYNNYVPDWYEMVTNVPGDWLKFVKDEYNSPNWGLYALLTGMSTFLVLNDDYTYKVSDEFYKRGGFNKNMSDLFTEIGDGRTQFGLAAAFAAYGFVGGDNRALRTASQIVEAVLAAGAVVQVLKHATGRESPFVATASTGKWQLLPNQIDYHKHVPHYDAFPSGHIATSVAAFVVIAENYPEYKWFIMPASYTLSALICIGMVNKGIHWYSDYPLGIAIGYTFGKLISNPARIMLSEEKNKTEQLSFLPYANSHSLGFSAILNF